MARSTDRILTTHVGSLPRPDDLLTLYVEHAPEEQIARRLRSATHEIVDRQIETGLDIVNDGEFGKPVETDRPGYGHGTWALYVRERLGGFEWIEDSEPRGYSKDRAAFTSFFGGAEIRMADHDGRSEQWTCTAPVTYTGHDVVARDIANLKAALDGRSTAGAFLPVASPTSIASMLPDRHYGANEEFTAGIAAAMREEYRAIADAGLTVQIDDPALVVMWDWWFTDRTFEEWLELAHSHVDILNQALEGIPPEQIRYHLCWGSWQGPHSSDVPLAEIQDLVLSIGAGAYSFEAANPRHEHEWKLWADGALPDGKVLLPGVVSHKTSVLEHPEVVADRIVRYAEAAGRENVIASTDCGMGGRIDTDLAWAKLAALVEGAQLASVRLWK